jgi:uncharacterized membrane protein
MEQTVFEFLRALKIPVSSAYCEKLIKTHPDFPSLLAIVDVLEHFGVKTIVGTIQKERVADLSFPALFPVSINDGETIYKSDLVLIKDKKELEIKREDLRYWDGIVLQVGSISNVVHPALSDAILRERLLTQILIALAVSLTIFFIDGQLKTPTIALKTISFLGFAGAAIGFILVSKDLGAMSKMTERFCSNSSQSGCHRVLSSKASSLFGVIKLSDAVLTFFIFQLLLILWLAENYQLVPPNVSYLALLCTIPIPMVAYSIYFQIKDRSWCTLCLAVNGIVLVQALVLFISQPLNISLSPQPVLMMGVAFATIYLGLLLVRQLISSDKRETDLHYRALRVMRSAPVFSLLLKGQRSANMVIIEDDLRMGSPTGRIRLLIVSNLYCTPCKSEFASAVQLVERFPQDITVAFRLVKAKDHDRVPNSNQYLIHYWLKFIHGAPDEFTRTQQMMQDWYDLMNLDKFMAKYRIDFDDGMTRSVEIESAHLAWIRANKVQKTPLVFLNGSELHKDYSLEDLMPMIPSFLHLCEPKKARTTSSVAASI